MVRTLGFHFWGLGSTPGRGTKILQAAQSKKKKKILWMKNKLKSRLQGEVSITSDMQMTPPLWQKAKRN